MNDNGKGLRALFYGLCSRWSISLWDEEDTGEMPADFYLLASPAGGRTQEGTYIVIAPNPEDRQVEVAALQARQEKFIILDADDINLLLDCGGARQAGFVIRHWLDDGTRAYAKRRAAGIMT